MLSLKGVFLDFGFVLGYPAVGIERKYFYLDWKGIDTIFQDPLLKRYLRPTVGRKQLAAFFDREIYRVFLEHEQTDYVDPQANQLLLDKLHLVFNCPIDQGFVDRLLAHIDTMKYITMDTRAVEVVAELKRKGLQLAIISNMLLPGKLLKAKLQETHILPYFDHITVSSDIGFIKPHPEIFRQTLAQSQLRANEVVFVGDTYEQDILGAKRAGLKTVWLNHQHKSQTLVINDPADFEIGALAELIDTPILGI
jgi:HAD superfamily hydrolase (TIGR01549 family)